MELVPSKAKKEEQQEDNLETSLVPRRRPDIYTVRELYQSLMDWTSPFMDVLTWQLPTVSSAWLLLGLLIINLLTHYSLPSLLGMLGLGIMGLVMLCAAILRVEPHVEAERRQILVSVSVPPEVTRLVACRLTNWTNRWVATGQYLLFGRDYLPGLLVATVVFNLLILCSIVDPSKLLMCAYSLAFVLPKLWPQVVRKWGHLWRRPLPPQVLRMVIKVQRLLLQLNEDIIQVLEQLQLGSLEAIPDEAAELSEQD